MRPNSSGNAAKRLFETRSTSMGKKHSSRGNDVSKLLLHGVKEGKRAKIKTTQILLYQLAGFVSCNRNYFHMVVFIEEVIANPNEETSKNLFN